MTKNTLTRLRNFVLLVLVQVLIFSRIHLFGYATVYIYLLFILKMPRFATRNAQMVWAFLLGLVVDMFSNTPGINAAAATFLAFMRDYVLAMFIPNGITEDFTPDTKVLRWGAYVGYTGICTLMFCIVLFLLELFTLSHPLHLAISISGSTLLTLLFVIVFESLNRRN